MRTTDQSKMKHFRHLPLPTRDLLKKVGHKRHILRHVSDISLLLQTKGILDLSQFYQALRVWTQSLSVLLTSSQQSLRMNASFCCLRLLTPKPPSSLLLVTSSHAARWGLRFSSIDPQRNRLLYFSISSITLYGKIMDCMQWLGIAAKTVFTKLTC